MRREEARAEIIAHRGIPRERTENTLPSFELAIERGIRSIELDVHATRDGVVVVHHDPVVRVGGGAGREVRIAAATHAELSAAAPPHAPIPTLAQVLELAGERVTLYVEVKDPAATDRVAEMLRDVRGGHAVHSFDHRVAVRTRELAPRLPTGILLASYLVEPARALQVAGARDYWLEWRLIDAGVVDAVHAAGGRLVAWTVNDPAVARTLASLGVDGLCSDVPHEMSPSPGET